MAAMAASLLYHVLSVRDDYLSSGNEDQTSADYYLWTFYGGPALSYLIGLTF